jgi:hypothetical protein
MNSWPDQIFQRNYSHITIANKRSKNSIKRLKENQSDKPINIKEGKSTIQIETQLMKNNMSQFMKEITEDY